MKYLVTFNDRRIGRNRQVEPLQCEADDADQLAALIYRYARPHLLSRDVEVVVDLEKMAGGIFAGIQNVGTFALTEVAGDAAVVA